MELETLTEIAEKMNKNLESCATEFKELLNRVMSSNYNFEVKQSILLHLNSNLMTFLLAMKGVTKLTEEMQNIGQH